MDGYGNQGRGRSFSSGQGQRWGMFSNSNHRQGQGTLIWRDVHSGMQPPMLLSKEDVVATIHGVYQELYSTRAREEHLLNTLNTLKLKVEELGKKETRETLLLQETKELKKRENKLVKETDSRNVLVANFRRELEIQKKIEEGLVKDLSAHKKRGLELQQDLNAAKEKEEERVRDLESKFKTREMELLTEVELTKKREEKLVEDLQIEKERRLELEQSAEKIASMRMKEGDLLKELGSRKTKEEELRKELDAKKKKEEELLKDVDQRKKVEELLYLERKSVQKHRQSEQDGWLNERKEWSNMYSEAIKSFEDLEKEKLQIEQHLQQELRKHEASLACKDSKVMTLQAQLAQNEDEERKWELSLIDHVYTVTANLKEFKELLHNPDKANPQDLLPICNDNVLEGKISNQVIAPRGPSEAQGITTRERPQRKLHLATINLFQEINTLKSTLREVATTWKQKHLELQTKTEVRNEEKKNYLFEVCKELDHYAVPMLNMLRNVKKRDQPTLPAKECQAVPLLDKHRLESNSPTKGKEKVTATASKRKLPMDPIKENQKRKIG